MENVGDQYLMLVFKLYTPDNDQYFYSYIPFVMYLTN